MSVLRVHPINDVIVSLIKAEKSRPDGRAVVLSGPVCKSTLWHYVGGVRPLPVRSSFTAAHSFWRTQTRVVLPPPPPTTGREWYPLLRCVRHRLGAVHDSPHSEPVGGNFRFSIFPLFRRRRQWSDKRFSSPKSTFLSATQFYSGFLFIIKSRL